MSVHPCPVRGCRDPLDPAGNPPLVATPICDRDLGRLRLALLEAPATYVALAQHIGDTSSPSGGERVAVSKSRPLPINAEVRALQETLCRLLADAEDALRLELGFIPRPRRGREGPTIVGVVRFLEPRLEQALKVDTVLDAALDLLRLGADVRRVLGLTRLVHRLPTPCPDCGAFELTREDGDELVVCRACWVTLDHAAYVAHVSWVASQVIA